MMDQRHVLALILAFIVNRPDQTVAFVRNIPIHFRQGRSTCASLNAIEELDDEDSVQEDRIYKHSRLPRLVFQNEWLLAVDKPAGMSYHSEFEDGVVKSIRKLQTEGSFPYDGEIHSVHRLDRVTSGLLLFAKTKEAANRLSLAFQEKTVQKFYIAVTDKKPLKKMGTISGDMSKSRRSQWKLLRTKENPAITRFLSQPIAFPAEAAPEAIPPAAPHLFLLRPLTGKTHQLRVALKALGAPILGDPLYNPATAGADRCYLHACAVRIDGGADGAPPLQIVLKPTDGRLFESESFQEAWDKFVLTNMVVQPPLPAGAAADPGRNMLACLQPPPPPGAGAAGAA